MGKPSAGVLSGIGAATIWGAMYVVSKAMLAVVPPFALLTWRLVLGAVSLAIVMGLTGWRLPSLKGVVTAFGIGSLGFGVSLGLQFLGTQASTAANGALVTSSTPAFVLLGAAAILRERITPSRFLALLLATTGVLIVVNPRAGSFSDEVFLGNVLLVGAALTWALYSVLVRAARAETSTLMFTTIALLGGLAVSIPGAILEPHGQSLAADTWRLLPGLLFLGVVCTAGAMFLWNRAFALVDASIASLTFFAQPLVGTLLGAAFLGERISATFVIGGLLIGAALVAASREACRTSAKAPRSTRQTAD